jgi:hypothetical protein
MSVAHFKSLQLLNIIKLQLMSVKETNYLILNTMEATGLNLTLSFISYLHRAPNTDGFFHINILCHVNSSLAIDRHNKL